MVQTQIIFAMKNIVCMYLQGHITTCSQVSRKKKNRLNVFDRKVSWRTIPWSCQSSSCYRSIEISNSKTNFKAFTRDQYPQQIILSSEDFFLFLSQRQVLQFCFCRDRHDLGFPSPSSCLLTQIIIPKTSTIGKIITVRPRWFLNKSLSCLQKIFRSFT